MADQRRSQRDPKLPFARPDLTVQAILEDWVFTGDMWYVHEDGYLSI